ILDQVFRALRDDDIPPALVTRDLRVTINDLNDLNDLDLVMPAVEGGGNGGAAHRPGAAYCAVAACNHRPFGAAGGAVQVTVSVAPGAAARRSPRDRPSPR